MYALLNPQGEIETYPYSFAQLQAANLDTSFPATPSDELLLVWNVVPVLSTPQPTVPPEQNVAEGTPAKTDGVWYQTWVITDKTPEQITQYNEQQQQNRLLAYERESDPIFFKSQLGTATHEEWVAKREEVKAQYPYIEIPPV